MAVEKMSISMDAELAEEVRRSAAAEGQTVSAWIAGVLAKKTRREGLRALLEEYQAEHGAFTEEELAKASRDMGYDDPAWR